MQAYRRRCDVLLQPRDAALCALLSFLILYLTPVRAAAARRRGIRAVLVCVVTGLVAGWGVALAQRSRSGARSPGTGAASR